MSSNQIIEFPADIVGLVSLEELNVDFNHIQVIPGFLSQLRKYAFIINRIKSSYIVVYAHYPLLVTKLDPELPLVNLFISNFFVIHVQSQNLISFLWACRC